MAEGADAVEIEVINGQKTMVLIDQCKGRATNPSLLFHLRPFGDASDKKSLAGAQLTDKTDDFATLQNLAEIKSPISRALRGARRDPQGVHQESLHKHK